MFNGSESFVFVPLCWCLSEKKREKYIYIVPWRWFLLRFCSCRTFQDGWLWQYALHLLRGSDHIALTFTAVLLRLLQKEKIARFAALSREVTFCDPLRCEWLVQILKVSLRRRASVVAWTLGFVRNVGFWDGHHTLVAEKNFRNDGILQLLPHGWHDDPNASVIQSSAEIGSLPRYILYNGVCFRCIVRQLSISVKDVKLAGKSSRAVLCLLESNNALYILLIFWHTFSFSPLLNS